MRPSSYVLYRSSNSEFYLRSKQDKTAPLFLIFDDISPTTGGSLGVGEFLRLISVGDIAAKASQELAIAIARVLGDGRASVDISLEKCLH